ncbi:MAG: MarR family transcriptional regulator [Candidatus Thorarchaeota archaeon]
MSDEKELQKLRREVHKLKETVHTLNESLSKLEQSSDGDSPQYNVFRKLPLDADLSWNRLMNLLRNEDLGLTATELAQRWGRSRSRTSEVLNKLADEGYLIKVRDGRSIRFRTYS